MSRFLPADAFWNLVIAWNLYLTLYRNYNADQLRALDWKYFTLVYGTAFVPAFVYCFVETSARGKVYGPAGLWCWISLEWDFIRLVTCYAPAWSVSFSHVHPSPLPFSHSQHQPLPSDIPQVLHRRQLLHLHPCRATHPRQALGAALLQPPPLAAQAPRRAPCQQLQGRQRAHLLRAQRLP